MTDLLDLYGLAEEHGTEIYWFDLGTVESLSLPLEDGSCAIAMDPWRMSTLADEKVKLAHELGHAFHDQQVFSHPLVCQEYTMPVAETASTFNEVLTVSAAIDAAESNDEKLALIESQLSDACQIICDIYSRFLFESSVFEARPQEFLDADRLCQLMLEAQKKAYGDGLDQTCLHPYMWLCKGHYYSGSLSFYNFPYAFGGLFARGLYAKYQQEGEKFVPLYKEMLHATSVNDVEDTAKIAGIDLTDKAFWRQGLQSLADEIDLFCDLVK